MMKSLCLFVCGGVVGALAAVAVVGDGSTPSASTPESSAPGSSGPELAASPSPRPVEPKVGPVEDAEPLESAPVAAPKDEPKRPAGVTMRAADVPEPPPDAVAVEELLPPGLKRARVINAKYDLFGDRAKYSYRVQLYGMRGHVFARSGLEKQPGRTTPDGWVQFMITKSGIKRSQQEVSDFLDEAWRQWEEESRLIGQLTKQSQALIENRASRGEGDEDVVAIEVRRGKAYVVRTSDDVDLRTLAEQLRGLEEQRLRLIAEIESER